MDDSPTVRKLVELTFRSKDWAVRYASNGVEAIRSVSAEQPRLMLLDVVLPDMPATAVCESLAGDPRTRDLRIVLMSAKDKTIKKSFDRFACVIDFIQKPFSPQDLERCLSSALRETAAPEPATMAGSWGPAEICGLIGASARTGALAFKSAGGSAIVYWDKGEIVFVTAHEPDDHERGLNGSRGLVDAAREVQKKTGKPVPITLFEANALPPGYPLADVLREAGRSILTRALAVKETSFEFREIEVLPDFVLQHGRTMPISRAQLLLGQAGEHWPSVQAIFRRAPRQPIDEDLELSVRERRVLALIDGRASLRAVADSAGLDAAYVREIAHALSSMRLIEPATRRLDANDTRRG